VQATSKARIVLTDTDVLMPRTQDAEERPTILLHLLYCTCGLRGCRKVAQWPRCAGVALTNLRLKRRRGFRMKSSGNHGPRDRGLLHYDSTYHSSAGVGAVTTPHWVVAHSSRHNEPFHCLAGFDIDFVHLGRVGGGRRVGQGGTELR